VRFRSTTTTAVLATAAVALVAGCSGGSTSTAVPAGGSSIGAPAATTAGRTALSLKRYALTGNRTGIDPKFPLKAHLAPAAILPPTNSAYKELAVADVGSGAVEILGPSFHTKSTITSGLDGPDGDWIDTSKNLYVANYEGIDVQEYAAGSTTPTFTYSAGLVDPIEVTTDKAANVYVGDFEGAFVAEYAQGSNTMSNECSPGGLVEGIAVDSSSNVFVSYYNENTGSGSLVEYVGGLKGCSATALAPTFLFPGGMTFAKDGTTLLAADQEAGVDVIPKPYTSITATITGASDTFHIAVTKYNHLLFITDPGNADVYVANYPSGTEYTTLGSANGLVDPYGVATYEIGKL